MADDEDGAWLHSSSPFMTVPVQMFVCCTVDPPVLATHPSGDGVRYVHFWCCFDRFVTRQQLETRVLEVMQGAGVHPFTGSAEICLPIGLLSHPTVIGRPRESEAGGAGAIAPSISAVSPSSRLTATQHGCFWLLLAPLRSSRLVRLISAHLGWVPRPRRDGR